MPAFTFTRHAATAATAAVFAIGLSLPAQAQNTPPERHILSLNAKAAAELVQDTMRIRLSTDLQGSQAQEVQTRLKQAVDAALAVAKPQAEAEKMEITTGSFRISPRYGKDNKIVGWSGYAQVQLEGTDFARISTTAANMSSLSLDDIGFGLSNKGRRAAEAKIEAEAVANFRARAQNLSQAFGYKGYRIRDVNIHGNDFGGIQVQSAPRMKLMAMPVAAEAASPVPAEPGKTEVQVSISGSIEMLP